MFKNQQNQPQADLLKIAFTALACYAVRSVMAPPKPAAFHFNDSVVFSDATKAAMFPQLLQHMSRMARTRPW